ncbi:rod shape-determining protein RodA [Rheinheimera sediminis]|uniref:rod shape-determining protein RodA n=1 Tax=Rheinheimera sp. YQF-1 TaxID=2499626 RepID=UPI000FD8C8E7|nr:rod shape-determining protein RodA [Rheinheimera sp. YQF-1]RVT45619.1 rod shape-determining protein RodA [Rheinheimera sp. YQF-1]
MNLLKDPNHKGLLAKLHLDGPLLAGLILLCVTGLFVLYSASGQHWDMMAAHSTRLVFAFGAMLFLAQVKPQTFHFWAVPLFLAGTAMLVMVLAFGHVGKGAQRWLDLGFMKFQPSEVMKLAVPMAVAWYVSSHPLPLKFRHLIVGFIMCAIPTVLIQQQPDLGTSILIFVAGVFVLFLGGMSWRIITAIALIIPVASYTMWLFVMHDYQKRRVLTFLNPESDPLGSGYHIIQSKIAIGSGGFEGKGWMHGTQSQLEFLPERHTDFIFSVFSEELGMIGVLFLLALYAFIIARGLIIASRAQDNFSKLLAGSITLTFFVYVFVNIGMVSGLLPVVGVPLPLVSYGGTSMVTLMAGFGILMSVSTHKRLLAQQ